jgi:hypothetical protein
MPGLEDKYPICPQLAPGGRTRIGLGWSCLETGVW